MKNAKNIKTQVLKLSDKSLELSTKLLRDNELVVFPTETVYGLGANALSDAAVRKIFEAKGRPNDNPLIVHVGRKKDVLPLIKNIPNVAKKLMRKFWPGPLTIVMKRSKKIPDIVTAGLDSVGIRMPAHEGARAVINAASVPLAAPSANISGRPSPTSAEHVYDDLNGRVQLILDGGKCKFGLESTVIDCTVKPPMLLRPGAVTVEQLRRCIGEFAIHPTVSGVNYDCLNVNEKVKSPGMKYRHYSPNAKVILFVGDTKKTQRAIHDYLKRLMLKKKSCEVIDFLPLLKQGNRPMSLKKYASALFSRLRACDARGVDVILVQGVQNAGIGLALMNRLSKAATEIVNV